MTFRSFWVLHSRNHIQVARGFLDKTKGANHTGPRILDAKCLMQTIGVHLLETGPLRPSRPISGNLSWHWSLRLLLKGFVPFLVGSASSKKGDARDPRAKMEIVLARGLATKEGAGVGKGCGQLSCEEGRDGLPARDAVLEEALLGLVRHLAIVDCQQTAVRSLF